MTPADRIRAAIEAEIQRSPVPPTTDDLAAAVCEALADGLASCGVISGPGLLAIAAELRGEVRNG